MNSPTKPLVPQVRAGQRQTPWSARRTRHGSPHRRSRRSSGCAYDQQRRPRRGTAPRRRIRGEIICTIPPSTPSSLKRNMPSVTNPMWAIDEAGDQLLHVGLHQRDEADVDHRDQRQRDDEAGEVVAGVGQDRQHEAEESVAAHLQCDGGCGPPVTGRTSTWASGSQVCLATLTFTANARKRR